MRLYLIRHGETVDNVAGLYAGSRDSALTIHGVQQAQHLGRFFAKEKAPITHLFASTLQRAGRTADAVRDAQPVPAGSTARESPGLDDHLKPPTVQIPELVEQDFGFYEGKPFYARSRDSGKSGKETHYDAHKDDPGFVDVEAKDGVDARCDTFLDTHLLPLFDTDGAPSEYCVVVVSHGITLSHLWRRLLRRLPRRSVKVMPEITAAKGPIVLEHLGGWSNTGFLEVQIRHSLLAYPSEIEQRPQTALALLHDEAAATPAGDQTPTIEATRSPEQTSGLQSDVPETSPPPRVKHVVDVATAPSDTATSALDGYATTILTVNGQQHLRSLKRTRGGIGRSRYDEGQKTLDTFFKRAKKA